MLALLWLVAITVLAVRTAEDVREARSQVREIRRELSIAAVLDGSAEQQMRGLRDQLAVIERAAGSPLTIPLRFVPGLDRQLESAQVLSRSGLSAADSGLRVFDELESSLGAPLPAGPERVALLESTATLLGDARAEVADLPVGPAGPLFTDLATVRDTAVEAFAEIEQFLGSAESVTRSVGAILSDGDVLLLAANNAEMRSGSGMFLQAGMMRSAEGRLRLEDLLPAKDIVLPRGAVDAGSETYDRRWGFLLPTVEWRNLAASPRFDVTAELASRMWAALGNEQPSGVLSVDPFALQALLRATGPVEVEGGSIGPDNVIEYLLNDQYDVFSDVDPGEVDEAQDLRRDQLGAIADAVIAALSDRDVDPVELVDGLRDAVAGRHILAWSADETVQDGWRAAGMSGELEADSLMVSVLNRGANKLDPFIDVSTDLQFVPDPGGSLLGTMNVALRSSVPGGEVRYVAGPAPGVEGITGYGQYKGFLSVNLPTGAHNVRIEGGDALMVAGQDGPVFTVAAEFVLGLRQTANFRITFELPGSVRSVQVEPTARPTPVRWTVGDRRFDDDRPRRVETGET